MNSWLLIWLKTDLHLMTFYSNQIIFQLQEQITRQLILNHNHLMTSSFTQINLIPMNKTNLQIFLCQIL